MSFFIRKTFFFLSFSLLIFIFFVPKSNATEEYLKITSDDPDTKNHFSPPAKREYIVKVSVKNNSSNIIFRDIEIEFIFEQSHSWGLPNETIETLIIDELLPQETKDCNKSIFQEIEDQREISHKTSIIGYVQYEIPPPPFYKKLLQKIINCIKNIINTQRIIIFIVLILFFLLFLLVLLALLYKAVIKIIKSTGGKNDEEAKRIFEEVNNNSGEKNNKEKFWEYIESEIQKFNLDQKILKDIHECLKGDGCKGTVLSNDKKELKAPLTFFFELIKKNISKLIIKDSEDDLTETGVGLVKDLYKIYSLFKEDDVIYYYFSYPISIMG